MPLTKAQILVLTSPQVRQHLPAKAGDFAYSDQLLREVGETCTRLPAVWDRIFYGLTDDTAKWLTTTYPIPGYTYVGTSTGVKAPPPAPLPRTLVSKAIEVIQSYKKSP